MVARHTVSRWGSRKRITFVVVTILLAMAAGWFIIRRNGPAALKAGEIDMILIALTPGRGEPPPPLVTTSDPAAISALVEALRDAKPQEDHKCMSLGIIELVPSNGPTIRLEFLPGHDDDWYEIRFKGEAYRIPRAPFVDAMRSLRVNIPLECL